MREWDFFEATPVPTARPAAPRPAKWNTIRGLDFRCASGTKWDKMGLFQGGSVPFRGPRMQSTTNVFKEVRSRM